MDLVTKQREERKQRILEVARRLIAERGYEGVTMRDLADESLVSVPTLYNLFGGKNELLSASVESYFLDLLGTTGRNGNEEGLEKLLFVCEMLSVRMLKHAAYARSLMGFFGGAGASETTPLREFVARELTNQLVQALEQMQAKRQLVPWVDVNALGQRLGSQMIITSFEWASHHLSDRGLEAALLFASASMLLGFARGKTIGELEALVRKHQDDACTESSSQERGSQ